MKQDFRPTWRKPVGILALIVALALYAIAVASAADRIAQWHVLLQTVVYIILGTAWLLPLRGFLSWMETGRWS